MSTSRGMRRTCARAAMASALAIALADGLPGRSAAQSTPTRMSISVGPTWRSAGYEPWAPRAGAAGRFAVEIPASQGNSSFELSMTASGFPAGRVTLASAEVTRRDIPSPQRSPVSYFLFGTPTGSGGMVAWEFAGLFRWYARTVGSGLFLGLGGGTVAIGENKQTNWHGVGNAALGYAFALGARNSLVVEERYEFIAGSQAPAWFSPLTVGLSWAVGS